MKNERFKCKCRTCGEMFDGVRGSKYCPDCEKHKVCESKQDVIHELWHGKWVWTGR